MNVDLARPRPGAVSAAVAAELPGLALHWAPLTFRPGGSPAGLTGRLRQLANGYRGAAVVAMRTKPVPAAYRNFFRQIGLDPDVTRPPAEQAALERLFHGTFKPQDRLADALLVALLETGVPIWALDGRRAQPEQLQIRTAAAGEWLGAEDENWPLAPGTLVLADPGLVHAVLFGQRARASAVSSDTREIVLFSVSVAGVPAIHVEEAFWVAAEALQADA